MHISGRELFGAVDLSLDLLPSYVTGTIGGPHPKQQDLAVAVNGTVEAVTRSYTEQGETKFGAMVPEQSIHAGANKVSVYAVSGNSLTELRGSDVTYALEAGELRASDGTTVPLGRAVSGEVRGTRSTTGATLGGWAANLKAHRPASSIVVFVDGQSVFVGENGNIPRKDILERYGVDKAGFIFRLPGSCCRPPEAAIRCECSQSRDEPRRSSATCAATRGRPSEGDRGARLLAEKKRPAPPRSVPRASSARVRSHAREISSSCRDGRAIRASSRRPS